MYRTPDLGAHLVVARADAGGWSCRRMFDQRLQHGEERMGNEHFWILVKPRDGWVVGSCQRSALLFGCRSEIRYEPCRSGGVRGIPRYGQLSAAQRSNVLAVTFAARQCDDSDLTAHRAVGRVCERPRIRPVAHKDGIAALEQR